MYILIQMLVIESGENEGYYKSMYVLYNTYVQDIQKLTIRR